MSAQPEWSRPVRDRPLPAEPLRLEATETERAALAHRFGLAGIDRLQASVALDPDGRAIMAAGELSASLQQFCAVSAEPFPVQLDVPLALRFVPAAPPRASEDEEEIELSADECDEIEYEGDSFDLGEALAQTLGLAIDPYATGPGAEAARQAAGIVPDDAPRGSMADALARLGLA